MSVTRKRPGREVTVPYDGGTLTGSGDAIRGTIDDLDAQKARERRVRERWGDGSAAERMVRLCQGFPTLRRVAGAGIGPWDAVQTLAWACSGVSHGERLAALFVLGVWNAGTDWNEQAHAEGLLEGGQTLERFYIHEAWAVWDHDQRQAALAWLVDPFWP